MFYMYSKGKSLISKRNNNGPKRHIRFTNRHSRFVVSNRNKQICFVEETIKDSYQSICKTKGMYFLQQGTIRYFIKRFAKIKK